MNDPLIELASAFCDDGTFVTRAVLVVEYIDSDGERAIWSAGNAESTVWDRCALLRAAELIEDEQMRAYLRSGGDD